MAAGTRLLSHAALFMVLLWTTLGDSGLDSPHTASRERGLDKRDVSGDHPDSTGGDLPFDLGSLFGRMPPVRDEMEVTVEVAARALADTLHRLGDEKVGVLPMQKIYDSLSYSVKSSNEQQTIQQLRRNLRDKLNTYVGALDQLRHSVRSLYRSHLRHILTHRNDCCYLDTSLLQFDSTFQTNISRSLSCDRIATGTPSRMFNPGRNLTKVFVENLEASPFLKWQYFSSEDGIFNVFPAHRFSTRHRHRDYRCDEGFEHRNRPLYSATVRPSPKYVVIVVDRGVALSEDKLRIAKQAAQMVISTLMEQDKVAVLSLSGRVKTSSEDECFGRLLAPASQQVKQKLNRFIDNIKLGRGMTDHALGFQEAFTIISNTFQADNVGANTEALILYMGSGNVSDEEQEITNIMSTLARENSRIDNRAIIMTYALVDDGKTSLSELGFLRDLANQDYQKYSVASKNPRPVKSGTMTVLNSLSNLGSTVGRFYTILSTNLSSQTHFSLPYMDRMGKGLILSITQPVYYTKGENDHLLLGIVGIDLSMADLMEDMTYYEEGQSTYAFVIDKNGYTLMHPTLQRPSLVKEQPLHTDISHFEQVPGFQSVQQGMLSGSAGSKSLTAVYNTSMMGRPGRTADNGLHLYNITYTWAPVDGTPFIIATAILEEDMERRQLMSTNSPAGHILRYHRLDLPQKGSTCMHLKQLATLETAALMLSPGSFQAPYEHLHQPETLRMVQHLTMYLTDNTGLLANPGVKSTIKDDVAATSRISRHWTSQEDSSVEDYIVRRYTATPSGVYRMYPGAVMDKSFDATRTQWYTHALENPGRLTLSAPHLDAFGAGYVVPLSQGVWEGRLDGYHQSTDKVVAVIGADFTLRYFYKLLVDTLPLCKEDSIRCFIFDDKGYMVAHPGLIEPSRQGPIEQRHITHMEPLVANDILNHRGFVQKNMCNSYNDRTIQRLYQFNTSFQGVLTNLIHGEHCAKYRITLIPGTNSFVGIVNQTCDVITAFCPCSMVDRLCLNCHRMEQTECECPCECPLQLQQCSSRLAHDEDRNPSCSTRHEPIILPHVDPQVTEGVPPCFNSDCTSRKTYSDCFGVLDCEWCMLGPDGETPLEKEYCDTQRVCFGGVVGSQSPYADEVTASQFPRRVHNAPVGPVAGGIMAVILVFALAIYFYRHHVHRVQRQQTLQNAETTMRMSQLDERDEEPDDPPENHGIGSFLLDHTSFFLATIERRPSHHDRRNRYSRSTRGTDSDHGYSTMTPHEDSENPPAYLEPLVLEPLTADKNYSERLDPPPQTMLGNKLQAPVQVHMVDTC
ncbi:VWFA and cache domain-containing protein 1-like isoform X1 [Branchiostoma floridae x Branchiostoma belcheri]